MRLWEVIVVIDPTKSSGKIQAAFLLEGISKRISRNHNGMPKIRLVFAILLVTKYFEVRTRYSSYNSVQAQGMIHRSAETGHRWREVVFFTYTMTLMSREFWLSGWSISYDPLSHQNDTLFLSHKTNLLSISKQKDLLPQILSSLLLLSILY